MTNVWNLDCADDSAVIIKVWDYSETVSHMARIDVADFDAVNSHRGMWFASKAKGKAGKWYVLGKSHGKTIMLHRLVMGVEDPSVEIDHRDNDGLNNRRGNLRACTHRENVRFRQPTRDWAAYDQEASLAAEYRAEREMANAVRDEFGLSRQSLWNIRTGRVRSSPAAAEYHRRAAEGGIVRFELLKMKSPKEGKFGVRVGGENR